MKKRLKKMIKTDLRGRYKTYSENYINPPIPDGYKYIGGSWLYGFIIQRNFDGSQFVWVPVGMLDDDGILYGFSSNEKFGRRNFMGDEFSKNEYHEEFNLELIEQLISIRKYGGFYISRYAISQTNKSRKIHSLKGEMPLTSVNLFEAKKMASSMETGEYFNVKSHLTYGAEYDSIISWFIKSKARTFNEIAIDSTNWGNYLNSVNSPKRIIQTGENANFYTNNICNFAGNIKELTQEKNGELYSVIRGGDCTDFGDKNPAAYRFCFMSNCCCLNTGFRVSLCIK